MKKILFICLVLAYELSHAITIEKSLHHYQQQEFENAYLGFQELAKLGNTKAQFNIGAMHARGEHVKVDITEALAWFLLVKENQKKEKKSIEDTEKVILLLTKKLDSKKVDQANKRSKGLVSIYGTEAVNKKYFPGYKKLENPGFKEAKSTLKNPPLYPKEMIRRKHSGSVDLEYLVEKDGSVRYPTVLASTHTYFSEAAIKAVLQNTFHPAELNGKPVYQYGKKMRMTFTMRGVTVDNNKANKKFKKLEENALNGGGPEKYTYAYNIMMFDSLDRIESKTGNKLALPNASPWFADAARDGFSPAKYELGKRLAYGKSCNIDSNKALFWLEQAAEQGLPEAQLMLGMELVNGSVLKQDAEKGLQLIEKSANSGLEHAILRYIWINTTSESLDANNVKKSKNWLAEFDSKKYLDKASYYESAIALQLAAGEFEKALKTIKKARKALKKSKQHSFRLEGLAVAAENKQHYIEKV